jgi:hypothetical protein
VLLGLWLLIMAVSYTLRPDAGIRRIPVTLAALLLLTLYGPLSVTSLSVASQGRRLARLVASRSSEQTAQGRGDGREASAALRFLLEHGARRQVAAAIPGELPKMDWDSLPRDRVKQETAAAQILEAAGIPYVSEYSARNQGYIYVWAQQDSVTPISGYDWMLRISQNDKTPITVDQDTVHWQFDSLSGVLRVRVGADSLSFDLRRLAGSLAYEPSAGNQVAAERLRLETAGRKSKAMLALESLNGKRTADSLTIERWQGRLFLGKVRR